MLADALTKPLRKEKIEEFVTQLGLKPNGKQRPTVEVEEVEESAD